MVVIMIEPFNASETETELYRGIFMELGGSRHTLRLLHKIR